MGLEAIGGLSGNSACLKILSQTEKVLDLILKGQIVNRDEVKLAA